MENLSQSTFLLPKNAQLTKVQNQLAEIIMNFLKNHHHDQQSAVFVIEGDAGTGKSVVLEQIFAKVQIASRTPNTPFSGWQNKLLVNHNEMLKIYWEIAKDEPQLRKKDFMKPTPFINQSRKTGQKSDVVFIDEAHLLLTKKDAYNNYRGTNQLSDILAAAKLVVLVFDPHQVIKLKSYWQPALLQKTLNGHHVEKATLDQQQRLMSPLVTDWLDHLLKGIIKPLPQVPNYELEIFSDGQPMYQKIQAQDQRVGLARMLATADFPFTVFGNQTWYVTAGSLRLPWDKINFTDRPWAQRPETLQEVGSIYTIQGFDLNYAGVIIGPSIGYDSKRQKLIIRPELYEDHEALKKRGDQLDTLANQQQIILAGLNILLKRGRYGLYLYACDSELRRALLAAQKQTKISEGNQYD